MLDSLPPEALPKDKEVTGVNKTISLVSSILKNSVLNHQNQLQLEQIGESLRNNTRKPEEIAAVVAFLKKLDFFKEMTPEMIFPVVKQLKFLELNDQTVICKEGEIGSTFYVLIKGEIVVYKD